MHGWQCPSRRLAQVQHAAADNPPACHRPLKGTANMVATFSRTLVSAAAADCSGAADYTHPPFSAAAPPLTRANLAS